MPDWVLVGDGIVNVDNIEYVERKKIKNTMTIIVYMGSGKVIEVTGTMALSLWKYLDSERLKFLDLENPTQDFSGT
jgi:hypothetical protein